MFLIVKLVIYFSNFNFIIFLICNKIILNYKQFTKVLELNSLTKKLISKQSQYCLVCNQMFPQLYSLAQCKHQFCFQCCQTYILSKCQQFSTIKCMFQGCNKKLDKDSIIYKKLLPQVKNKIKKHDRMVFLNQNSNYRNCAYKDCQGIIKIPNKQNILQNKKTKSFSLNKNQRKDILFTCDSDLEHHHCNLCFKQYHQGDCKINDQEQLKSLNFKRCPKCFIWVQKVKGCQYISCKCGINFCYACGRQFSKDLCRKRQVWQQQLKMRKILKKLKIKKPQGTKELCLFIPRLLIISILAIGWTLIVSLLPMEVIFFLGVPLIFTLSPLILLLPIHQIPAQNKIRCINQRLFWKILLFLFYPVIGTLFGSILLIIILLYPLLRKSNHHGIYDPFDYAISKTANIYLKGILYILKAFLPS